MDLVNRHRIEIVKFLASLTHDRHQVRILENLQMLRNRLSGHVHVLTQGDKRQSTLCVQQVEQLSSGWVSEGFEDSVDFRQQP